MKVSEIITKARIRLDDPIRVIPADQLWKTDELIDYLAESLNEFARRTEYWFDTTTPEICEVPIVAGQAWANIDERIIRIRRAKLDLNTSPLGVIDARTQDMSFHDWDSATNTGYPRNMMLGEETDKVLFDRTPIDDDTMRLHVVRYPLEFPKADSEVGVPDKWVLKLLTGIRAQAYKKQDADTFDANRALSLEAEYNAELLKITHEIKKMRRHPRQVQYRDVG